MKVIFVDRNIVAMMQYYNEYKEVLPGYSRQYAKIRKYDRNHNLISLLLSSAEGTRRGIQTAAEMKETIVEDSKIVKDFTKEAKSDGDILAKIAVEDTAIFAESFLTTYMDYVSWASSHIKVPLKVKDTITTKDLLINKAIQDRISPTHPVVLSCLAVLYGNQNARDMIRGDGTWANRSDYNAVSDIMILSRLCLIKALDSESYGGNKIKPIFITRDEGLTEFLDSFIVISARTERNEVLRSATTFATLIPKRKLFPKLGREAFVALVGELQGRQTELEQRLISH